MRRQTLLFGLFAFAALCGSATAIQAPDDWRFFRGYSRMPAHYFRSGMGVTAGMTGARDFYLAGDAGYATMRNSASRYGSLQQVIGLRGWQGKRLSVSVRLKNEGEARAWAVLQINQPGGINVAAPQRNAPGDGQWETHRFVLDVPDTADEMILQVGLTDRGRVWVDSVKLEAAGPDAAVTESRHTDVPLCCTFSGYGLEGFW